MLAWYNNAYLKYFDESYIKDYFVPKRVQQKIWSRAIYPDDPLMRQVAEDNATELRQTRFINNDKFQIESTICLYGSRKINIVSYKDKMGVIITSQSIYNTLKSIFEVMWDGAKE